MRAFKNGDKVVVKQTGHFNGINVMAGDPGTVRQTGSPNMSVQFNGMGISGTYNMPSSIFDLASDLKAEAVEIKTPETPEEKAELAEAISGLDTDERASRVEAYKGALKELKAELVAGHTQTKKIKELKDKLGLSDEQVKNL